MAARTIDQKDQEIIRLTNELEALRNEKRPVILNDDLVALKAQLEDMARKNEELERENQDLRNKNEWLELEAKKPHGNPEAEAALKKRISDLNKELGELNQKLEHERERNMQLRMKAGHAFKKCLETAGTGGVKSKKAPIFVPGDDKALERLIDRIDLQGGGNLTLD